MVKCVTCQKVMPWKYAQAGHFVPKSRGNAVYFEWRNVHPQCPGCNLFSVQSATIAYHLYVEKMYGRDEVLRLLALAGERRSLRKGDYLGMIEFYNLCLREVR